MRALARRRKKADEIRFRSMTHETARSDSVPYLAARKADRQFARARRHSRRVRLLKIGVPIAAAALLLVFAVWAWWSTRDGFVAEITGAAVEDGKLVMTDARLNGFTRENLPYSLSAERAVRGIGGADLVELEQIEADVPLDAAIRAAIVADGGLYDNDNKLLDITSEMTVTTTTGVVARVQSAHIDVASGGLATGDPVRIEMQGSTLMAGSMRVTERGRVILFADGVRLTIAPGMDGLSGRSRMNGE